MRHTHNYVLLMIASTAILVAQMDPPGRVGRLNYTTGPVSFQPAGMNEWVDATVNRPLAVGDQIWVGDRGRSELHIGSTALRLGPNTAFQFLNLDDQTVQIRLSDGTISIRLRSLSRNQVFEVATPNLAFNILRPGDYRIDANADSQTTAITVRSGAGEAIGGGQVLPVRSGQQIIVRGGDQISYSLESSPRFDEWDQWSAERDRREEQAQSVRYVSREMTGYEDLDQYGRWGNQPGYGNVWMPTSVSAGWAPYQNGHWVWISPWGWTWVDDAPWGFAPYHYGRWASFSGRWGWIPGPHGVHPVYAPALVGWIGGGGGGGLGFSLSFSFGMGAAVGWFPLGPREPYFPSYYASRDYFSRVNTTNTVINNTTINNYYGYSRNPTGTPISNINYVNRNVQNGVTAIPQEAFSKGRGGVRDVRTVAPSQLASTQVFGAPAIAPQREGILGARADTASRAARPSANVLSRPVVVRATPPPAVLPFDRQQSELKQNPGRALNTQQMRQGSQAPSAPVRVVDMKRVQRVQPVAGSTAQPVTPGRQPQQQTTQPRADRPQQQQRQQPQADRPRPSVVERQPVPATRQQQQQQQQQQQPQQQTTQPRADRPQQQRQQPQADRPQPSLVEKQPVPATRQQQQQQQTQPRVDRPQQQQPQQRQADRPQPSVVEKPSAPATRQQQTQQPRADRPSQQQRQQPHADKPTRPPSETRQPDDKGKPDRPPKQDPGGQEPPE